MCCIGLGCAGWGTVSCCILSLSLGRNKRPLTIGSVAVSQNSDFDSSAFPLCRPGGRCGVNPGLGPRLPRYPRQPPVRSPPQRTHTYTASLPRLAILHSHLRTCPALAATEPLTTAPLPRRQHQHQPGHGRDVWAAVPARPHLPRRDQAAAAGNPATFHVGRPALAACGRSIRIDEQTSRGADLTCACVHVRVRVCVRVCVRVRRGDVAMPCACMCVCVCL